MKHNLSFNRKRILLNLLATGCVTVVVISIIMLISTTSDYNEGAQAYDDLTQHLTDLSMDPDAQIPQTRTRIPGQRLICYNR